MLFNVSSLIAFSLLLGSTAFAQEAATGSAELLSKRASGTCSRASHCKSVLTANQLHACVNHLCKRECKTGYHEADGKCVRRHAARHHQSHGGHHKHHHHHSTSSGAGPKTTTPGSGGVASNGGTNLLRTSGVTEFLGNNGNAIASWFRTNNGGDSTNGHSWCGFPYNDQVPGFAPDVVTMLDSFGGNYEKAATAYCGLEAEFTTPDGRKTTLVIADGFDRTWVRTPSSVDVVIGHYQDLSGHYPSDKNDVIQGVTWKFTGKRNEQYKFKGQGSG